MTTSLHQTTPADMRRIASVLADRFSSPETLPFSFRLGGETIHGMLQRFSPTVVKRRIDANLTEMRFSGADPATGLRVELDALVYHDFPVYEWTLWLENTGDADTPVISEVRGGEFAVNGESPVLHHGTGDHYAQDNFETVRSPLPPGETVHLEPYGGRSCNGCFPYLRVLCEGWGLNIAIGWPGQWAADARGTDTGCSITAGQQYFHARLRPGERVRGPRMCVMAFDGDEIRAANLWRRWHFAHVMPRQNGEMIKPKFVLVHNAEVHYGDEFIHASEQNQLEAMATFRKLGYSPDIWWIDAGWYPCPNEHGENQWWRTGTWEPDPARFPDGMGPVGAAAAEWGADFLMWYEPERVTPGSWLDCEHSDWLLKTMRKPDGATEEGSSRLLNLAMPECADWLIEHVDAQIKAFGLKIYRQDFNFDPLPYWLADAPDRLGVTENLHTQNYLRFWDELLWRNPGLAIDSCASGGRRNDLEAMRRAVPLHFTDYGYGDFAVNQAMYHTMFCWIPYFRGLGLHSEQADGTFTHGGPFKTDLFSLINAMTPSFATAIEPDSPAEQHAELQRVLPVWRRAAEITLKGDFYPITPYTKANDAFCCTQFDVPEEDCGFVQMLVMPQCAQERFTPKLYIHSPDRMYRFVNLLTGETRQYAGNVLRDQGFEITLEKRSGAVWFYTVEK
ncbi:MAG: alpha-galactosidase [Armatimonadota bacterium]